MAEPLNRAAAPRQTQSYKTGLLIGKKAITGYLCISRDAFYEFLKLGMPARAINGRWYAHRDNLEDWWKLYTRHQNRVMEEAE